MLSKVIFYHDHIMFVFMDLTRLILVALRSTILMIAVKVNLKSMRMQCL